MIFANAGALWFNHFYESVFFSLSLTVRAHNSSQLHDRQRQRRKKNSVLIKFPFRMIFRCEKSPTIIFQHKSLGSKADKLLCHATMLEALWDLSLCARRAIPSSKYHPKKTHKKDTLKIQFLSRSSSDVKRT
jgi:hypothetical protein